MSEVKDITASIFKAIKALGYFTIPDKYGRYWIEHKNYRVAELKFQYEGRVTRWALDSVDDSYLDKLFTLKTNMEDSAKTVAQVTGFPINKWRILVIDMEGNNYQPQKPVPPQPRYILQRVIDRRERLKEIMEKAGRPLTNKEIRELTEMDPSTTTNDLQSLRIRHEVKVIKETDEKGNIQTFYALEKPE